MGNSTSSMFYAFAAFLVIYLVGVGVYSIVQMVKKRTQKRRSNKD